MNCTVLNFQAFSTWLRYARDYQLTSPFIFAHFLHKTILPVFLGLSTELQFFSDNVSFSVNFLPLVWISRGSYTVLLHSSSFPIVSGHLNFSEHLEFPKQGLPRFTPVILILPPKHILNSILSSGCSMHRNASPRAWTHPFPLFPTPSTTLCTLSCVNSLQN